MKLTIGGVTFDQVVYDQDSDVLYLHVGEPRTAVDFNESPEGHALRFNSKGELVGLTLLNPKWSFEHNQPVVVTMPVQKAVSVDSIDLASVFNVA